MEKSKGSDPGPITGKREILADANRVLADDNQLCQLMDSDISNLQLRDGHNCSETS